MNSFPPIFFVLVAGAAAPVIWNVTRRFGLSVVVIELLLGVAIGPQGLDWVRPESGMLTPLSKLGMAFLFFIAGVEIDLPAMGVGPLRRALAGWALGLVVAWIIAEGLSAAGIAGSPSVVIAVALATTALGVLMPILGDAEVKETPFGQYVIAAGAVGEIGPILLMSLVLSRHHEEQTQAMLTLGFVVLVVLLAWLLAKGAKVPAILRPLRRSLDQSGQLPIRTSFVLLVVLALLAEQFGLDLALGALAAGMIVAYSIRGGERVADLHAKLDAVGYGFLIPLFFVVSGMKLDVAAVFESHRALLLLVAFVVALPIVRLPLIAVMRNPLGTRRAGALGLLSATTLSLIVVLTQAASAAGIMSAADAAALVGSGILSVIIFPAAGLALAGVSRSGHVADGDESL